jgi:hypothetical protein
MEAFAENIVLDLRMFAMAGRCDQKNGIRKGYIENRMGTG